ncbi:histidine phosphatase family protein [uncultured Lactobacillus sp.]|uniref:histidine phosphatase family protein n=1 Tax=uncultured Lactobacillus sp. TaxID=153152 RepID=UPI0028064FE2|nr:histidine phosphatase family protein [uncultured Lactobacillus sp.]
MRLLVIRHGQSEADILKVCEGRANFALTEKGHQQAEKTAEYIFENYRVDKIYSSTLKRAMQTANHIAKKVNLKVIPEDKLQEFDNGLRAGLPFQEAYEKYPNVPTALHESHYHQESELEFRMRAEFVLSRIISENASNSTIVIVSHGGMIMRLYQAFLELPVGSNVKFITGDAGIHDWSIKDGQKFINYSNYCPSSLN